MSDPRLSRRSLLSLATAGTVTALAAPAWAVDGMRPGAARAPRLTASDRQIVAQLRPENALRHLRHLTESIGQRYTGTPQEKAAADYIAATLDGYGYDVELETFTVPDRRVGELSGRGLPESLCWGVGSGDRSRQDVAVAGSLMLAPSASPADLPQDLAGAIVMRVVASSGEDITPLAVAAAARGAVAVVSTRADAAYPRQAAAFAPRLTADVPVPVVGVGQVQKHALLELLQAGPVPLTVTTTSTSPPPARTCTPPVRAAAAPRTCAASA